MDCENNLCVYWEADSCILDTISIDSLGRCAACILISIDEKTLKAGREKFLARSEDANGSLPGKPHLTGSGR